MDGSYCSRNRANFTSACSEFLAVVPGAFRGRADVLHPAIGQPQRASKERRSLPARQPVMRRGRLDEIARLVTFMVVLVRPARAALDRVLGVEITVRLLRAEQLGNPLVEGRAQPGLGGGELGVALRIEHQGETDRFDRVVDPGVGERRADVFGRRPASLLAACTKFSKPPSAAPGPPIFRTQCGIHRHTMPFNRGCQNGLVSAGRRQTGTRWPFGGGGTASTGLPPPAPRRHRP